jgi:hypothetical protein
MTLNIVVGLKRAYEQNPEAVKKWVADTYPEISERAKKRKGGDSLGR